jgi:hypothetical protein
MPFETSTTLSSAESMRDSLEITFESLSKSDSVLWVCSLAPGTCEDHPNSPETTVYPSLGTQSIETGLSTRLRSLVTAFRQERSHRPRVVLYSCGTTGQGRTIANEASCLISWSSLVWRPTYSTYPSKTLIRWRNKSPSQLMLTWCASKQALPCPVFFLSSLCMALLSFTIFPIVSDAVEGIHATIDTREYGKRQ